MVMKHRLDGTEPSSNVGGMPPAFKPEHIAVFARHPDGTRLGQLARNR
jgi:hypothetical protein